MHHLAYPDLGAAHCQAHQVRVLIRSYPPNLSAQTLPGPLARLMTTPLPRCALAPMADTLDQQPKPSATDAN
jgi:hypothetical protein